MRATLGRCGPPDQVRTAPEEHDDVTATRPARLQPARDAPSPGRTRAQRCRGSEQTGRAPPQEATRLDPARRIARQATAENPRRQAGPRERHLGQLDGPQRAPDRREVCFVANLFVPQQLRPRAVRCVGEVLDRSLTIAVPSPTRLELALPEEGEARVDVTEADHVATAPASERDSRATTLVSALSGSKPGPRIARGARPPSALRARSNQRRMPSSS